MTSKQPTKASAEKTAAPAASGASTAKKPASATAAAPGAKKQQAVAKAAAVHPKKAAADETSKAPAGKKEAAVKKSVVTEEVATETDTPVTDKWLLEQQELLLKERDRLTHQAESLKAEADQLAEDMEPGDVQFDEESGEGNTVNVERERDLALSAQARAEVEEIDRALAKIGDGSYGICERCGQPIPKPRLKAVPQATLCVPCKSGGLLRR